MWRRVVLALRVPPPPPCQGTQQLFLLEPQHLLHPRLSLFLSTSPPNFCAAAASIEKLDPNPPFAYYEILHIPRHANQSQVKTAFYQQSKKHHPDVAGESQVAKDNFAALNLAYSILRDPSQRYHYDVHGVSLEEFQKKEEENIYKWEPKYSVYTETHPVDGETTELEDWFTAQGHVRKPSVLQFFKNCWVELKFGFSHYDFPWQWKLFFIGCVGWTCLAFLILEVFKYLVKTSNHRKPVPLNSKWNNPDQYDILWYAGIRKNRTDADHKRMKFATTSSGKRPMSELEREADWKRRHNVPERRPKPPSEYSHTIYSNTRSRTMKKNKERHKVFLKERKAEAARVQLFKEEQKRKAVENGRKKRRKVVGDGFSVAEKEKKKMVGTLTEEEKDVVIKMRKEKATVAS